MRSISAAAEPTAYVVDDDPTSCVLVAYALNRAGVSSAVHPTAESFLAAYGGGPGCLILDVQLPGMGGVELLRRLGDKEVELTLPVLVLTGTANVPTAVQLMRGGAFDLIEKPFDDATMVARVKDGFGRNAAARQRRQRRESVAARQAALSSREREVMDLIVAGLANKQIAMKLGLSEKTIEAHRSRVMHKMGAEGVVELVKMAVVPHDAPLPVKTKVVSVDDDDYSPADAELL